LGAVFGQLGIELPLFIAQAVNFIFVVVLLRLFLYEPILNMLDKRKERIAQGIRDAERSSQAAAEAEKEKAAILEEARREAQEVRAQATRDAERLAQEVRARAESESTEIRQKAAADAAKQKELILADAHKEIAALAIAATEQILGRELKDKKEQERFVSEFLTQQSGGK
jgi:F-type H+-transporting ATPase subunit b